MNKITAIALLMSLTPLTALAQYGGGPKTLPSSQQPGTVKEAAAAAASAGPLVDSYAAPACKKPVMITNLRKADDTSEFNEKFNAYQECIKAYVDNQNKLANAHVTAANAAVEDANNFVKEINDKQQSK